MGAEQCLDGLIAAFKAKKPGDTEKEVNFEELSDSEFCAHITNKDDSKAALLHKVDRDAGVLTTTYRIGDHDLVDFTWHVHKDPLRLEVSNTWPHDEAQLYDSYQWAQR